MTKIKYSSSIILLVVSLIGLSSSIAFIVYYLLNKDLLNELNMYFNKNTFFYMLFMLIIFTVVAIIALLKILKLQKKKM